MGLPRIYGRRLIPSIETTQQVATHHPSIMMAALFIVKPMLLLLLPEAAVIIEASEKEVRVPARFLFKNIPSISLTAPMQPVDSPTLSLRETIPKKKNKNKKQSIGPECKDCSKPIPLYKTDLDESK